MNQVTGLSVAPGVGTTEVILGINNPFKLYAEEVELIPRYKKQYDAGFDFRANIPSTVTIRPGQRVLIPTGVYVEMPPGRELQIRPRSGLALDEGITVLNAPGTIDCNYRGEIGIILINTDQNKEFVVERFDRIAQGVVAVYETIDWLVVSSKEDLSQTERGATGFGGSGVK